VFVPSSVYVLPRCPRGSLACSSCYSSIHLPFMFTLVPPDAPCTTPSAAALLVVVPRPCEPPPVNNQAVFTLNPPDIIFRTLLMAISGGARGRDIGCHTLYKKLQDCQYAIHREPISGRRAPSGLPPSPPHRHRAHLERQMTVQPRRRWWRA
jgi:hypothetical protein